MLTRMVPYGSYTEARCVLAWLCDEIISIAGQFEDDQWISLMAACTWDG